LVDQENCDLQSGLESENARGLSHEDDEVLSPVSYHEVGTEDGVPRSSATR
jgi:hypothetical protein